MYIHLSHYFPFVWSMRRAVTQLARLASFLFAIMHTMKCWEKAMESYGKPFISWLLGVYVRVVWFHNVKFTSFNLCSDLQLGSLYYGRVCIHRGLASPACPEPTLWIIYQSFGNIFCHVFKKKSLNISKLWTNLVERVIYNVCFVNPGIFWRFHLYFMCRWRDNLLHQGTIFSKFLQLIFSQNLKQITLLFFRTKHFLKLDWA